MDDTVLQTLKEKDNIDTKRFLAMIDTIRNHVIREGFIQEAKENINITFESLDTLHGVMPSTNRSFTYSLIEQ